MAVGIAQGTDGLSCGDADVWFGTDLCEADQLVAVGASGNTVSRRLDHPVGEEMILPPHGKQISTRYSKEFLHETVTTSLQHLVKIFLPDNEKNVLDFCSENSDPDMDSVSLREQGIEEYQKEENMERCGNDENMVSVLKLNDTLKSIDAKVDGLSEKLGQNHNKNSPMKKLVWVMHFCLLWITCMIFVVEAANNTSYYFDNLLLLFSFIYIICALIRATLGFCYGMVNEGSSVVQTETAERIKYYFKSESIQNCIEYWRLFFVKLYDMAQMLFLFNVVCLLVMAFYAVVIVSENALDLIILLLIYFWIIVFGAAHDEVKEFTQENLRD